MKGPFKVRYAPAARDDLLRLLDHLLDQATTEQDFDDAQWAIHAVTEAVEGQLGRVPFIYRKAGASPFLRELIVPHRRGGYVVLYEIEAEHTVTVLAVRHQLEDDYH